MSNYKKLIQPVLACVCMLFLAACATSGESFKSMQPKLPPVAADAGRLVF